MLTAIVRRLGRKLADRAFALARWWASVDDGDGFRRVGQLPEGQIEARDLMLKQADETAALALRGIELGDETLGQAHELVMRELVDPAVGCVEGLPIDLLVSHALIACIPMVRGSGL